MLVEPVYEIHTIVLWDKKRSSVVDDVNLVVLFLMAKIRFVDGSLSNSVAKIRVLMLEVMNI